MLLFDLTYIFQFNSSATPGSGNYFGYNGFMFNVVAIKDKYLSLESIEKVFDCLGTAGVLMGKIGS